MARFFTSDHHFGHDNIIQFADRPWRTLEDAPPISRDFHRGEAEWLEQGMHSGLVAQWNERVGVEDDVYVVGDFFWHDDLLQKIVPKLNGSIFLIPGNHDSVWRARPHWRKFLPAYEAVGITVLGSQEVINIGDTPVILCHFPYTPLSAKEKRYDDKFSGNRPTNQGGWLLHGHTHSPEQLNGRQIHIGVDAWRYYPVSETVIQKIIETGDVGEHEQTVQSDYQRGYPPVEDN